VAGNRDAEIAYQAEMAKNAEIREEAVKLADDGRAEEASYLLRRRAEYLNSGAAPAPGSVQAAQEMKSDVSDFEEMASYMTENDSMSNEQRKKNLNKAYIAKNQQSDANDQSDGDEGD
jgi:Ca-activated chloride channel family protein